MIVCSCNVLTDHDVRSAVNGAEDLPRNAKQIYGCLGCSAECGRCARTIKKIIDEALGACAKACCSGCPHSQAHAEGNPQFLGDLPGESHHHHAPPLTAAA
jgi:bacterioferritin-associated ferredoxin